MRFRFLTYDWRLPVVTLSGLLLLTGYCQGKTERVSPALGAPRLFQFEAAGG